MRIALAPIAAVLFYILPTAAHADPGVLESGYTVRKFATVPQPVGISIAPDGTVFVGNDPPGNGSAEPARIRMISPDGSTVTEIGPLLVDPDMVVVDVAGDVANAGEVIVGAGSALVGLDPSTGSTTTLFAGWPLNNIGHMVFDDSSRLFVSGAAARLAVVDNGSLFVYTSFGGLVPSSMASDGGNTLYTAMYTGELYDVPLDGAAPFYLAHFGLPIDDIAYGVGAFGNRVFAGDRVGNILVYDPATGQITTFAQGFARANSIEFGPDGSLYISDFAGNAIWVIEAPASLEVAPGAVEFGEVAAVWSAKTSVVTLSNAGSGDIVLTDVSMASSSDACFSITSAPASGTVLGSGAEVTVTVFFAPDETGEFAGTLVVKSDDPTQPTLEVPVSGEGTDAGLSASEMLGLILDLYRNYTTAGKLAGTGHGRRARGRRHALHSMLASAKRLVDKGHDRSAMALLKVAHRLTDGESRPPDFVTGEGAARLAFLIGIVMDELDDGAHPHGKRHRSHHGSRRSASRRHCK